MSGQKPRERNRAQWARIAGVLAEHPDGLPAFRVAALCGYAGRSRERAVTRYRAFLSRMEWHGQVTRREDFGDRPIIWRLAAAPAVSPDRLDFFFGDAGSVSVVLNVRWLDLPEEKATKLRKIIKELEALAPVSRVGQTGGQGKSGSEKGL